MSKKRQIEMRRDGGENKNTIRMYILPRLLGFLLCLRYALVIVQFVTRQIELQCNPRDCNDHDQRNTKNKIQRMRNN